MPELCAYNGDMTTLETLDTSGKRIAGLLLAADMTQTELAERMGVTVQALNAIVKGRRVINVKRARQIAAVLNTSMDYLTLASDDPSPRTIPADEPDYWHAETDEVARLVDAMPEDMRLFVLDFVRLAAARLLPPAPAGEQAGGGAWGELAERNRLRHAERVQPPA